MHFEMTRGDKKLTLGVDKEWPGRKRPVLYLGNEYAAQAVASFHCEACMQDTWAALQVLAAAQEKPDAPNQG